MPGPSIIVPGSWAPALAITSNPTCNAWLSAIMPGLCAANGSHGTFTFTLHLHACLPICMLGTVVELP